ncbi:MAG: molybdenum cofactor biosysynthesis protein [Actinomycetota bacterium]|nr:molybdenum cofactor biosysynthesis protein [Actinomycetota bacterium]
MERDGLVHHQRIEIVGLLVSPVHRYGGRPDDGPVTGGEGDERRDRVEVRGGLGIVGDRYFGSASHRRAAITLIAAESIEQVGGELDAELDPFAARRNVIVRGLDVDGLVGATLALDSGHGEVTLAVRSPARPCSWMERVLAPGAHRALSDRGGVRCEPLDDGVLVLGPAVARADVALATPPG